MKIGDRVIVTRDFDNNADIINKTATVMEYWRDDTKWGRMFGLEFDEYIRGHSLSGNGRDGYC